MKTILSISGNGTSIGMLALILSSLFCEILLTLRLSLPGLKALMVTFATPVESLILGFDSSARLGLPKT